VLFVVCVVSNLFVGLLDVDFLASLGEEEHLVVVGALQHWIEGADEAKQGAMATRSS
jgi:hypothetical protein